MPGLGDITAWVDFTAVAEAAVQAGFQVAGFTTQTAFLLAAGIEDELRRAADPLDATDPRDPTAPLDSTDPRYLALARGAVPCYSLTLRNAQERPYASLVGVSSRMGTEERRTCIVKQLTRALGLLNTSNATWSVTAAGFRHAELPSGDVKMLQLLYSAKLTQGMTQTEVRKLAPDVLKQLAPGG